MPAQRCRTMLLLVVAFLESGLHGCGPEPGREIVVFAAASLGGAVEEAGALFERDRGVKLIYNFAASGILARQIEASRSADVFVSADEASMDDLDRAGCVEPGTRTPLLSNALVLIARRDASVGLIRLEELRELRYRHLAIADPDVVPAGRYARAALERVPHGGTTLWEALRERMAPTADVRAALALVESDPEIMGIVYRTDALASPHVRVLYEFPAGSHPKVRYTAALVAGRAGGQPAAFLEFLKGPACTEVFRRRGFTLE